MNNNFATLLQDWRERSGLSGRELSKRVGLSPSAINKAEAGIYIPQAQHIRVIARELGLNQIDEILFLSVAGYIDTNTIAVIDNYLQLDQPDQDLIATLISIL